MSQQPAAPYVLLALASPTMDIIGSSQTLQTCRQLSRIARLVGTSPLGLGTQRVCPVQASQKLVTNSSHTDYISDH
jgi:hypothetical protein